MQKKVQTYLNHFLKKRTIDEHEYFFIEDKRHLSGNAQTTFLMPDYDEYGMSYKDRQAISNNDFKGKIAYNRMLIADGLIAGSWKRTIKGNKVILDIRKNVLLNEIQNEKVISAAKKYAAFLNKLLEIA